MRQLVLVDELCPNKCSIPCLTDDFHFIMPATTSDQGAKLSVKG